MSMILYLSAILNCSPILSVYGVYRVQKRTGKGTVYTIDRKNVYVVRGSLDI